MAAIRVGVPVFVVRLERDGFASREGVRVILRGSRALHVGVERELRVYVRVAPEDLAERVDDRDLVAAPT